MRMPRDITGDELARRLSILEYRPTRQTGSHLRLTTDRLGEHHITIPRHDPLKIGILNSILRDIAAHHRTARESLIDLLFG